MAVKQYPVNKIIELYNSGLSISQVHKITGIFARKISQILDEAKILKRPGWKVPNVNNDYFKNWSHNMAWILGFTMADGCIIESEKGRQRRLSYGVALGDVSILEFIKSEIYPEANIHESNYLHRPTNKLKRLNTLVIFSEEIFKDLNKLDIFCRKTGKEKIPDLLPQEYLPSFIRGFFDGDGTIGYYQKTKNSFSKNLGFTTASPIMIKQLLSLFPFMSCCKHIMKPENKMQTYDVKTGCLKNIKVIGNFMYSAPGFFLKRKKDKFLIINNF